MCRAPTVHIALPATTRLVLMFRGIICRSAAPTEASSTHSADRESSFPLYRCLPKEKGTYLYLIMCLICRFIVKKKSAKKYISKIGQNTGMLKLPGARAR